MRGRLSSILAVARSLIAWLLALLTLVLCALLIRSAIASDVYAWQTGSPAATSPRYPGRAMFSRLCLYELATGWGGLTLRQRGNERYDETLILYQRNGFHYAGQEPVYARVSQQLLKLGLPWLGAGWGEMQVGLLPVASDPQAALPRDRARPETFFVTDRWYARQITLPIPLLILLAGIYPGVRLRRWLRAGARGFPVGINASVTQQVRSRAATNGQGAPRMEGCEGGPVTEPREQA